MKEIKYQTIRRFRTVNLAFNITDLAFQDAEAFVASVKERIISVAESLREVLGELHRTYGFDFESIRLSISPLGCVNTSWQISDYIEVGCELDNLAQYVGAEFIGGFSVFAESGLSNSSRTLIQAMPEALQKTEKLCSFINVASSKAGIDIEAIKLSAGIIKAVAEQRNQHSIEACARFAVSCNIMPNIPYMPLSFADASGPSLVANIGVGGIDILNKCLSTMQSASLDAICARIADEVRKMAQDADKAGRFIAGRLEARLGAIDISLSPMPIGLDFSLLQLFRYLGIDSLTTPGALAALAMVNDAVKRGGLAGSMNVNGLSGTFISVAEDTEIYKDMQKHNLSLDRLLALTSICSVGIDMVAIPYSTTVETIAGIIADEAAIGWANMKTTAVRLILVDDSSTSVEFYSNRFLGKTQLVQCATPSTESFLNHSGNIPPNARDYRN